jgi:putative ABC transport system permease protein
MNAYETLKLALSSIWAHKLRSFLTLLGMIIGMAAFMVVLSLLLGFNQYVDEKIAGIGSNAFNIQRFNFSDFSDTDTLAAAQRRNKELTFDELDFIRERAQTIDKIGAKAGNTIREVRYGTETMVDVSIRGVEPIVAEIDNVEVLTGRYFTDSENNNTVRVAFVGTDIADGLFPRSDPIGKEIMIDGLPYRVIGIRVAKGTVFGQPQDSFIELPLKTFGANFGGLRFGRAPYFVAIPKPEYTINEAVEEARTLMRVKRRIPTGEPDNFGIITPDAITSLRDSIFRTISIVILIVPVIALVVGAIVIMNIRLVAVTERTKEIGLRKSLGARRSDILKQFLFESATLAAIGGVIGLALAVMAGFLISLYFIPTRIPWWAAVIAISVSAAVGILAGLYPASKAADLDPIEALRAE